MIRSKRLKEIEATLNDGDILDEITGNILREIDGEVVELRFCSACHKWKPVDDYNKGSNSSGLSYICRDCNSERSAAKRTGQKTQRTAHFMGKRLRDLQATIMPGDRLEPSSRHLLRVVGGEIKEFKFCSRHKEWEPIENFGKKSGTYDGLQPYCREVQRDEYKNYARRQKAKMDEIALIEQSLKPKSPRDFTNLSQTEIQEVFASNTIPIQLLFAEIAKQTGDRFSFTAFDRELGLPIVIA